MFMVLLGLVFSKRTFLESSPGVNYGAIVGSEAVNWLVTTFLLWEVETRN
jgi:hypothetical protein